MYQKKKPKSAPEAKQTHVKLSVRGTVFVIPQKTFERLTEKKTIKETHDGCIYVDRNPRYFHLFLDCLAYAENNTSYVPPDHFTQLRVIEEYMYFGLGPIPDVLANAQKQSLDRGGF